MKKNRQLALTAAVALPMLAGVVAAAPASANTVRPNISSSACGPGEAQWVHVDYVGIDPVCYGYTGTIYLSDRDATSLCAGNNAGQVTLSDGETEQFWPGGELVWGDGADIYSLTITGWSGSWSC
jgi:hypothetical protein